MSWGEVNWLQLAVHIVTTLTALAAFGKWLIKTSVREEISVLREETAALLAKHNDDAHAHPTSAAMLRLSSELERLEAVTFSLNIALAIVQDRQTRKA